MNHSLKSAYIPLSSSSSHIMATAAISSSSSSTSAAASSQLAANADARKQRLLALKKRKVGGAEGDEGELDEVDSSSSFLLRSRNFDPITRQPIKRPRPTLQSSASAADGGDGIRDGETIETRVQGLAQEIVRRDERKRKEELDLLNIAPKRANWDLKRDMDKRMKKLERRTVECYAILFRQRLQAMKGSSSSSSSSSATGNNSKNGVNAAGGGADLLAGMAERQKEVEGMTARERDEEEEEDDE